MKHIKRFILFFILILPIHIHAELNEHYKTIDDMMIEAAKESLRQLKELSKKVSINKDLNSSSKHSLGGFKSSSPIKIMPLGDSITYDASSIKPWPANASSYDGIRHAYRNYLWYKLNNAGYNVNFVGSKHVGWSIVPNFDIDNEGWPGVRSYQIAGYIYSRLQVHAPNIILLHIGTNDTNDATYSSSGLNNILNEIDRFESNYGHPIKVILAKIIDSPDSWRHHRIRDYNNMLVSLANSRKNNGDDIVLVDMYRGAGINYNVGADMVDILHPNNSGYYKMANVWFNALKNILQPPIPTEPTDTIISEITDTTATLSWTDTSDNEDGFKIYHGATLIATVGANTTHYILTGLTTRTAYTFTIKAYNSGGESNAVNITFTTKDDYAWLPAVYHTIIF